MQNKRIFGNELKYIKDVLNKEFRTSSNSFMVKKLEKSFEKKFNSNNAISFTNGTSTMHACLEAAEIGIGDEVIVPPLTMSATSIAVLNSNATPVFADVNRDTFLIDFNDIEKKITKKTKAIITVSLFGLVPEMDEIIKIAKKNKLLLIEDNAECFLGYYKGKLAGNFGDAASYSFQSSKHITCGEGGMLLVKNNKLAEKIRSIHSLGYKLSKNNSINKAKLLSPNYFRHYNLGWNYRMSDLCAAVAMGQLENLDYFVKLRIKVANLYNDASSSFSWFKKQKIPSYCEHSYWSWVAYIDGKNINWSDFQKKFIYFGGSALYGSWKLTYKEPFFKKFRFNKREKLISKINLRRLKKTNCPNAEYLQKRLFQFKTNFYSINEAKKEAYALNQTLKFFN